jgi:hypothetical protein
VTARQLLGITPIRLHPIARLHWHQGWRYHVAPNAQLCQLPADDIPLTIPLRNRDGDRLRMDIQTQKS